jgi:hypothetical protein
MVDYFCANMSECLDACASSLISRWAICVFTPRSKGQPACGEKHEREGGYDWKTNPQCPLLWQGTLEL